MRTLGKDLRVGDTIEVWWEPREDTITKLVPYTGSIAVLKGAQLADFEVLNTGMTIEAGMAYDVIRKG